MREPSLKIAIWHNLPSGGGKRALHDQVAGLATAGHEVRAWCPPTARREFLPLSEMIDETVVDYASLESLPWRRFELPGRACRLFHAQAAAMDNHCRTVAEAVNRWNPDVFLSANCRHFAVSQIGRYITCPKVIYHQEPARHLYEAMPHLGWLALPEEFNRCWPRRYARLVLRDFDEVLSRRLRAREERRSVGAFDTILVNSAFSRETMLRTYGLDSEVCYLGVDVAQFTPRDLPREPMIVGLGAIRPHKGVELAVQTVAAIPLAERPRLLWIGNDADPNYRQSVCQLAEKNAVSLEIQELVPDEVLRQTLNRASAMIYVSRLEPFGYAPLEANACGLPVVAVAEGGVRETIEHGVNGLLCENRNSECLAGHLLQLLRKPDYAKQMGEAAIKRVRDRWSLESAYQRFEAALRTAIGRVRELQHNAR